MDPDELKLLSLDLAIAQKRVQEVLIGMQDPLAANHHLIDEGLDAINAMKALAAVKGIPHLEAFAAQLNQAFLKMKGNLPNSTPNEIRNILMPIAKEFNQACSWAKETGFDEPHSKTGSKKLNNLVETLRDSDRSREKTERQPLLFKKQAQQVTVESIFKSFIPWIQHAANTSGKKISIDIRPSNSIEVSSDKAVAIQTILIHLLRNAVFHGIETVQVRESEGKPAQGTIEWRSDIENNMLVMVLSDDGTGIADPENPTPIWQPENYTTDRQDALAETSIFSVNNQQTGLGLGLHIVKTQAEKLGGEMILTSALGVGTSVRIQVPVSGL